MKQLHLWKRRAAEHAKREQREALRDEFAKAALVGLLADPTTRGHTRASFAFTAYQLADEMMRERDE